MASAADATNTSSAARHAGRSARRYEGRHERRRLPPAISGRVTPHRAQPTAGLPLRSKAGAGGALPSPAALYKRGVAPQRQFKTEYESEPGVGIIAAGISLPTSIRRTRYASGLEHRNFGGLRYHDWTSTPIGEADLACILIEILEFGIINCCTKESCWFSLFSIQHNYSIFFDSF